MVVMPITLLDERAVRGERGRAASLRMQSNSRRRKPRERSARSGKDWLFGGAGDPRFAPNPLAYNGWLEWRISPPGLLRRRVETNIGVIDFMQGPTYPEGKDLTQK
jgi:hypothetical protein